MKTLLLTLLFCHIATPAFAFQLSAGASIAETPQAIRQDRRNAITGRVLTDSGQPLAQVTVTVVQAGRSGPRYSFTVATDEQGAFEFVDLPAGAFKLSVTAPGYIRITRSEEPGYHRLGESVSVTMRKGGVIAGAVRTASGEPVIGAAVRAIRIRDLDKERPLAGLRTLSRQTDDRGFYRIYGIEPGIYIVSVDAESYFPFSSSSKGANKAPTFHPSSTRDTAVEIPVRPGQEVTAVDITQRDEPGYAVSGTVSAASSSSNIEYVTITLRDAATGSPQATLNTSMQTGGAFAVYGVPAGKYVVLARSISQTGEKDSAASQSQSITIAREDVTGLKLVLRPLGSVSGRVVLLSDRNDFQPCEPKKNPKLSEAVIALQRHVDSRGDDEIWGTFDSLGSINEEGVFSIHSLNAGQYQLSFSLPSPHWFIKSISNEAKSRPAVPLGSSTNDLVSLRLKLGPGDQLGGFVITLSDGGAIIEGRVSLATDTQSRSRLYVDLIPTENEHPNDVVRYFQVLVNENGDFSIRNIPPGNYRILVRQKGNKETSDGSALPLFWDDDGRRFLRREAATAGIPVVLRSCQRVTNYLLRY